MVTLDNEEAALPVPRALEMGGEVTEHTVVMAALPPGTEQAPEKRHHQGAENGRNH